MSNSERMEIRRSGRAYERLKNTARSNALYSRYCRLEKRIHALNDRLRELGAPSDFTPITASEVQIKTRWMINENHDGVAIDYLNAQLAQLGRAEAAAQQMLENRISELQRRFRRLEDERQRLSREYSAFMSFRVEGLPSAWPADEKNYFVNLYRQLAAGQSIPPYMPGELNKPGVEALEEGELKFALARQRMAEAVLRLRQEKSATEARLFQLRPRKDSTRHPLTSILPPLKPAEAVDEMPPLVPARVDQITAQVGAADDIEGWGELFRKIEYARRQGEANHPQAIFEEVATEAAERLKARQELDRWRNRIDELIDSVAHLKGSLLDDVTGQLEQLRHSAQPVPLDSYQIVLQHTAKRENTRREREQRRFALVACFLENGYSFVEGSDHALAINSQTIAARPRDNDYGASVSVNEDVTTIETTLLRLELEGEVPIIPELRRRRDLEQREAWKCDLALIMAQMEARGFAMELQTGLAGGLPQLLVQSIETSATVPGPKEPAQFHSIHRGLAFPST